MLSEKNASILLNMDSWEIFSPFTEGHLEADISSVSKDINKHNSYEILVGLEGVYPYYYNGNCYNCKPGSIFFISPMLEHESYYTKALGSLTHMWIHVNEQSLVASVVQINDGKMKGIYGCKICCESYMPKLKIYEIWNSLLNAKKKTPQDMFELKLAIFHFFLAVIESKQLSIDAYREETMLRAKNYIKKHFHQKIKLSHLARKMGYSKFHFIRLFKGYHKITVQEYIDQHRLKEVKHLLANKVAKKEIAYKLGFSSPSAFANWYSKYRNM